jgi:hypothetical protein
MCVDLPERLKNGFYLVAIRLAGSAIAQIFLQRTVTE